MFAAVVVLVISPDVVVVTGWLVGTPTAVVLAVATVLKGRVDVKEPADADAGEVTAVVANVMVDAAAAVDSVDWGTHERAAHSQTVRFAGLIEQSCVAVCYSTLMSPRDAAYKAIHIIRDLLQSTGFDIRQVRTIRTNQQPPHQETRSDKRPNIDGIVPSN